MAVRAARGSFTSPAGQDYPTGELYGPIQPGGQIDGNSLTQAAASELAETPEVQWRILSSAIPAMSSPVGSGSVPKLEEEEEGRNVNMMSMQNGWPQERKNNPELGENCLHSDIKNIALPYVYEVYENIIEKGG